MRVTAERVTPDEVRPTRSGGGRNEVTAAEMPPMKRSGRTGGSDGERLVMRLKRCGGRSEVTAAEVPPTKRSGKS